MRTICLLIAALACSPFALAEKHHKSLKLYQQPSTHSKVVTTLEAKHPLQMVDSQWVQVRDSQSHKTGWIKRSTLDKFYPNSKLTIAQHSDPHRYQLIEYSSGQATDAQIQALIQHSQAESQRMQQALQHSMQQADALMASMFSPHTVVMQPIVLTSKTLKAISAAQVSGASTTKPAA